MTPPHSPPAVMISAQSSLADLARFYPGGTAVLHRNGLDFCCGGARSLAVACEAKGLDASQILQALERNENDGKGAALHLELWDAPLLVRYIEMNHHAYLRQLFPTLTQQIAKVVLKHGDRHPEIHAISELYTNISGTLERHMLDEEHGVFQAVRTSGDLSLAREEISRHETDHEAVGRSMDQLRLLTNNFTPPADACNTHRSVYTLLERLVNDTMQHVFLENAVLFPMLLEPPPLAHSPH